MAFFLVNDKEHNLTEIIYKEMDDWRRDSVFYVTGAFEEKTNLYPIINHLNVPGRLVEGD